MTGDKFTPGNMSAGRRYENKWTDAEKNKK